MRRYYKLRGSSGGWTLYPWSSRYESGSWGSVGRCRADLAGVSMPKSGRYLSYSWRQSAAETGA
jgi:hypothetical protein